MERAWARVVLGWVTSWEVLVLHPLFPFRVNLVLPSLAEDRLPLSLFFFFFFYRGNHSSAIHYIGPTAGGVRARGVGTMGMGRTGTNNRGPSIENGPI